jgi:hypothetical protein
MMTKPEHFEVVEGRGVFRPIGEITQAEGVRLITSAIIYSREQELHQLLVVTTGFTGLAPSSIAERYFFVREWAAAAGPHLRIAMVARPELIDPEKFGVTVAANAGLIGDVFTSEHEALAWLNDNR